MDVDGKRLKTLRFVNPTYEHPLTNVKQHKCRSTRSRMRTLNQGHSKSTQS